MPAREDPKEEKVVVPLQGSIKQPEKKRGFHEHKHKIRAPLLLFIVIILGVLLAGGSLFYIQNKAYIAQKIGEENPLTFSVDHLLLKVLLKEGEFAEQEIRVMNIANHPQAFSLVPRGLQGIVSLDSPGFSLDPGQTKVVKVSFRSRDEAAGVEQQPGIYIGSLVVNAEESKEEIPLIVEIESKNVLFDANLNPISLDRAVERGKDFVVEVRLFNLQSIDAQNVDMHYTVKDIHGNTLITESETVVVKTQASFFKTLSIPKNLASGTYVFGAETLLGDSKGTSSYLFEIIDPSSMVGVIGIMDFCRSDPLCSGLSLALIVLMLAIAAYFYLFLGAYFYGRLSRVFPRSRKDEQEKYERKAKENRQREGARLEQEKLDIEKRKQRLEMIKLLIFGKKEGRKKGIDAAKILSINKKIEQAEEQLRSGSLKRARQHYEAVMKSYHALSLDEKKAAYNSITSLYQKLVGAENEHHENHKEEESRQQAERLKLEVEKKQQQELARNQREQAKKGLEEEREQKREMLKQEQEMLKQQRADQKKASIEQMQRQRAESRQKRIEERQRILEGKNRLREELRMQKEEMRQKAADERRKSIEEQAAQRMRLQDDEGQHLEKLEKERQVILSHLSHSIQEFDGLIKALSAHEEAMLQKQADLVAIEAQLRQQKQDKSRLEDAFREKEKDHIAKAAGLSAKETDMRKRLKTSPKKERLEMLKEFQSKRRVWEKTVLSQKKQDAIDIQAVKRGIAESEKLRKEGKSIVLRMEKAESRLRTKLAHLQTEILELQQRRGVIENSVLSQRRDIAKLKGGLGSLSLMFASSRYRPSRKDPLMRDVNVPERKMVDFKQDATAAGSLGAEDGQKEQGMFQKGAFPDTSFADEMLAEIEGSRQEAEHSSKYDAPQEAQMPSEDEEKEDEEKKSPGFRRYAKALEEAKVQIAKKNREKAKKSYLLARQLYLKLEYHERTQAYRELNDLYNELAS